MKIDKQLKLKESGESGEEYNPPQEEILKDKDLPSNLNCLPLDEETDSLVNDIIKEKNLDKLKDMTKLFELNQSKKNILRVVRLNNLLDKVNDQAIERFEKRPDEIDNMTLLNYMKVVQESIKNSQDYIEHIGDATPVQLNQHNNVNFNINGNENINRESKEKVIDVVTALLKDLNKSKKEADIIDVDTTENKKENN